MTGESDSDDAAGETDAGSPTEAPLLSLPQELRSAFKEPFGPVYTDAERLLADAGSPLIAVGDIVTFTLEEAGTPPDVALVDGRTKREAVDEAVRKAVVNGDRSASNPAGTLTSELLTVLADAIDAGHPTRITVDGEEDLAAVPAVIAAPVGATVVYGQPDEGMVAVDVTEETSREFRELLAKMDGDVDRALALLGG